MVLSHPHAYIDQIGHFIYTNIYLSVILLWLLIIVRMVIAPRITQPISIKLICFRTGLLLGSDPQLHHTELHLCIAHSPQPSLSHTLGLGLGPLNRVTHKVFLNVFRICRSVGAIVRGVCLMNAYKHAELRKIIYYCSRNRHNSWHATSTHDRRV